MSIATPARYTSRLYEKTIPQLGVGLLYNPSLELYLDSHPACCDYVEIIPDMFWSDLGNGHHERFEEIDSWMAVLHKIAAHYPLTAHNISYSLGSAGSFDMDYLRKMEEWHRRYSFVWHSDHLSFVKVHDNEQQEHNAGMAVPVPYDYEVLDMIGNRINTICSNIRAPFLVENNVYFIDLPDQELTETGFLNELSKDTSCGLLLDIHNVYCNAVNHGFDARDFITALDLEKVIEIHIAGGNEMAGMYTDSHAGPCPEAVWELLVYTLPLVPNLCGITFEFHESYFHLLQFEGINRELNRAKTLWNQYHT
ncbi:DUF692 domain-containing protein [Chitinophaga qingshengii]|uniref:DUF692 family protein n=1 Tax=Chitinophaga qingshengii TaxID=1569794 RepID=A0ABR7TT48_9BACT|nr:DUF692 family multinuclear iron-containing protein [Chitinophaga qingshengii]MBC9933652.1 DUF692 family protein [Chitinophaga qingshengii]